MTLPNAVRRFGELGFEVARDAAPYKYKYRRIGALAWRRGFCLDYLWQAAQNEASELGR